MSDVPRRVGRPGGSPPPRAASPVIAVVITLIAAVIGFFILNSLDDDDGDSGATPDVEETTTSLGTETTVVAATTTTVDKSSFQLLVANASGVPGSAAAMTDELQSRGFRTLEPSNVVPGYGPKDVTEVFYLPGFEAQGQSVAGLLGVQALPMPATKPVSDTDFVGATVLVVLGTDLAGQPFPGTAETTETTVAGATETVAGSPNDTTTSTG